jgi:hypothetical protein
VNAFVFAADSTNDYAAFHAKEERLDPTSQPLDAHSFLIRSQWQRLKVLEGSFPNVVVGLVGGQRRHNLYFASPPLLEHLTRFCGCCNVRQASI